jgi:uracil phosphoribosyltransferase
VHGAPAADLLARLRDGRTPSHEVRRSTAALAGLVVASVLADAELQVVEVRTPVGPAVVGRMAHRVTLVPVLRAGLALVEPALAMLPPSTRVGFLGLSRDEETLEPHRDLYKLPVDLVDDEVLVLEVMIATGGSACAALGALREAGATRLRLAGLVAAPEGLARLVDEYPNVPIAVAAVDERLDARGFIVPGLGDAGDRLYGDGRAR